MMRPTQRSRRPVKLNKTGRGNHLAAQAAARAVPPPPTEQDIRDLAEIQGIDSELMSLNNKDRHTEADRQRINALYARHGEITASMSLRQNHVDHDSLPEGKPEK